MSSLSYVKQEIAKHNKANQERERSKSSNQLSYNAGKGDNSGQRHVATPPSTGSYKYLATTQQNMSRTEEHRPKPKVLPSPLIENDYNQEATHSSPDRCVNDSKNQKATPAVFPDLPPRPLPHLILLSSPPQPVVEVDVVVPQEDNDFHVDETPSLPPPKETRPPSPPFTPQLQPTPGKITHAVKDSHVSNSVTPARPGVISTLPARPPQRPPPPLSARGLLPPPPPPPQDPEFNTQEDSSTSSNKKPSPPSLSSEVSSRPPQRPPPPSFCTLPSAPPTGVKLPNVHNFSEHQPSATKEVTTSPKIHRSNSNRIPVEKPSELIVKGALGHKPPRPIQPFLPGTPTAVKSNADLESEVREKKDSFSSSEESGDSSDEYATPEEYEKEPEPSTGRSTKSYQVNNVEDHNEASPLELEIADSDEDWDEGEDDGECDSSDASEVQLRHNRETHGLVTKTMNDAIAINVAMKYVSGFFDLPVVGDTKDQIGSHAHATAGEIDESTKKTLWKDLPVVKSNPVYKKMGVRKRKLHETIFEIMSTEALYISLLNSFEEQKSYFPSEEVMAISDHEMFFSRLLLVKQCSEAFFEELERCWQESIFLHGIFDAIEKHATNNFGAYVKYCTSQARINKMFTKAQKSSGVLSPQLKAFQSFLMLPMQRITRLPLLIESILQQMSDTDREYPACKRALAAIRKKAAECNEDDQNGDRMGGLLELSSHIVFPDNMLPFPLISASRWLRKRTQATLRWHQDDEDDKTTSKKDLELFLFNDVFFICSTKRRDDSYLVQSYCRQSLLEITPVNGEFLPSLPTRYAMDRPGKHVFVVDILSNQNERREIMVMSMRSQQERDSWLQAAPPPPIPDASSDICYEPWDCPIVVALLPFEAATPYQLSLAINDKMHVTRRKTIGWYEGERLSDRKTGFFPVNCTMELDSPHKRAREIRERFYQVD